MERRILHEQRDIFISPVTTEHHGPEDIATTPFRLSFPLFPCPDLRLSTGEKISPFHPR